jgi:hypothetical protein
LRPNYHLALSEEAGHDLEKASADANGPHAEDHTDNQNLDTSKKFFHVILHFFNHIRVIAIFLPKIWK